MKNTITLINYIVQTALLLWLFGAIEPIRKPDLKRSVGAVLSILALLPLYFVQWLFPNIILRFIYRVFLCTVFLMLGKGLNWQKAAYFSAFCSSIYYIHQNIFITPALFPIYYNVFEFTPYLSLNLIFSFLTVYVSCFLLYALIYKSIPFNEIGEIGYGRLALTAAVACCSLYVKYSLTLLFGAGAAYSIDISIYPILLQLLLIAMIICFESYLHERREQEASHLQEVTSRYKLQNIRNSNLNQEELRILTHDIKNHLLAIRRLSNGNKQIDDYISGLLGNYNRQMDYVETGNALLNGLLSEKIREAAKDKIEFSIILDSRSLSFINDMDLCTIFGNAIDNAIEACRKVQKPADRYISVRSAIAAGSMIIIFENPNADKISLVNGLPPTSKPSYTLHGIGLSSIRSSLLKYKGTISINIDDEQKFILNIIIPLPDGTVLAKAGLFPAAMV